MRQFSTLAFSHAPLLVRALLLSILLPAAAAAMAADVVVYKSPTCGCCKAWVTHMRDAGFGVEAHDRDDMGAVKQAIGVPRAMRSCHTAVVGGYVIEGHVPAATVARLLKERPSIVGLAVPGMVMGSPGMEGPRSDPYDVMAFGGDGGPAVYESRR